MDDTNYSIPDLLQLLKSERGDRLECRVTLPPILVIKGHDFEIEGPPITEAGADELFRSVAESRDVRAFRKHGVAEFIYTFKNSQFVVHAKKEFGYVHLDISLVAA
jgi:hypothetical protein